MRLAPHGAAHPGQRAGRGSAQPRRVYRNRIASSYKCSNTGGVETWGRLGDDGLSSVRLRSWEEPALSRQHPAAVIGLHMGGAGDGCDPEGMTVVGEVGVSLLAI